MYEFKSCIKINYFTEIKNVIFYYVIFCEKKEKKRKN